MTNRQENKIIRDLFKDTQQNGREDTWVRHYNDANTRTRRRVFKTYGDTCTRWLLVLFQLEEMGITGWELYEDCGIKKYIKL